VQRIAVIAELLPDSEQQAQRLLDAGPPFDPGQLGLTSHDVYLAQGAVVFAFEGPEVERLVSELVDDPATSGSFSAWGPLLAGPPTIARPAYHWPDASS
jgi:hypothetical protein